MTAIRAAFDAVRREDPSRIVIYQPANGVGISAAALWDAHERCVDQLGQAGLQGGRLVVAATGNAPATVALLVACRTLGLAMLPVDPGATAAEIDRLAERFGAAAIFDTTGARVVHPAEPRSYPKVAILKLTSGSTGLPKATLTSEAALIADYRHIAAAMDIRPSDVQIAAIPISHSYGLGNLLLPLLMQGTAMVLRASFVPHQLPADARRFCARIFPGVPFMFEYFIEHPPGDGWPPTLKRLISAGAPLAPAVVRAFRARFGVTIHSFYGASEVGGIAFDDSEDLGGSGTVGRPLPGVTVTLRDGRVHVASAAVADGYSDGDDSPFVDGGYLTGDYADWDGHGRLVLRGRVSEFVNVAGRKVQPREVEEVLRTMEGVADVRVVAAPDPHRGEQIAACVVARSGDLSALAVRQFCAARLAAYKIPRSVVFVDAIPLTPRGKTDRAALDALVRARLQR